MSARYQMPASYRQSLIAACHHEAEALRTEKDEQKKRYITAMLAHGLALLKRDSEQQEKPLQDDTENLKQNVNAVIAGRQDSSHICDQLIDYVEAKLALYNPDFVQQKPDEMKYHKKQIP